jgi:hypothetical protein
MEPREQLVVVVEPAAVEAVAVWEVVPATSAEMEGRGALAVAVAVVGPLKLMPEMEDSVAVAVVHGIVPEMEDSAVEAVVSWVD